MCEWKSEYRSFPVRKLELYLWLKKWILSFLIGKVLFCHWSLRYNFLVASQSLPYFFHAVATAFFNKQFTALLYALLCICFILLAQQRKVKTVKQWKIAVINLSYFFVVGSFFLSSYGDEAFSLFYSEKCNNFIFLKKYFYKICWVMVLISPQQEAVYTSNSAASQALNTAFKADGCSSVLQLLPRRQRTVGNNRSGILAQN